MRKRILICTMLVGMISIYFSGCSTNENISGEDVSTTETNTAVNLTVTSTIFGSADTGNKSTLKKILIKTEGPGDIDIYHYDENGNRVAYEDGTVVELNPVEYTGEAIISLGDNVDDNLIDSSKAVVKMVEGDGYSAEELILNATKLDGNWQNGKYNYILGENDIEWNTGNYPLNDENSTREWSCFGGDGNGCYTFNLEVSGIKYDGKEVEPYIFQVKVYIWGRDATDLGSAYDSIEYPKAVQSESNITPTDSIVWTWEGEGDKPVLCDNLVDNFYVTWPEGEDASSIGKDNVEVTLYNQYGVSYKLKDDEYEVFTSQEETQIAVTYMHWATTPVYTTMKVVINSDSLLSENEYDIASVYTYLVQSGGGGVKVDGTVTAYSYYGFENLTNWTQVMNSATYVLAKGEEESLQYYAENEDGIGYLTYDEEEAKIYDASDEENCNVQLIINTVMTTTRLNQSEEKEVNGEIVTLNKVYEMPSMKKSEDMVNEGLKAANGYIIGEGNSMWAWQKRFDAGWTPDKEKPTALPYTTFPYGF